MQCAIYYNMFVSEHIVDNCLLICKEVSIMVVDRRVRKTQSAIKKAFIQLLKQKDLERITINDITEAADINRGTFYLHYEDKYDLLAKMEDEYAKALYDKTRFLESMKTVASIDEFYELFSNQVLRSVVTHVYHNLEFYQVILTIERQSQLEERISQMILENMKIRMNDKGEIAGIPVMYFHSYVSGSMLNVIKYWVQDDNRVDIDTLIEYISKIVFNGPVRLLAMDH